MERYVKLEQNPPSSKETPQRHKMIDDFKEIISGKVDKYGVTAMAAYKFIKKKGYAGKYCTVANFVRNYKGEQIQKATIQI